MFKALLLLVAASISFAHAGEAEIKSALQKKLPQIGPISQINKSPIAGLYEVVTEGKLYYTDENALFLVQGSMIDLTQMRNITEERARKLFAIDFNALPFDLAVKIVNGNGERKLAIFTDPNCGYCKKLEPELKKINHVTIYHFMLPYQGSAEQIKNIWCSKDRAKAWQDLMLRNISPAAKDCDTPTNKVLALAKKLRVEGTPQIILVDGSRIPGYVVATDLENALAAAAGN